MNRATFRCPHCRADILAPPSLAGASLACPKCRVMVACWPAPEKPVEPAPVPAPAPRGRLLPPPLPPLPAHRTEPEEEPARDERKLQQRSDWHDLDRWAWALVAAPIIGSVCELLVGRPLLLVFLVLNTVFAAADERRVRAAGCKSPSIWWGILLVPVYLWKRATHLQQPRSHFWGWVASLIISFAISWHIQERSDLENSARPLVTQIIQENGGRARCTSVEISGSSGDGYYNAIATLDNGKYIRITIQKTKNMVYVEIPRQ